MRGYATPASSTWWSISTRRCAIPAKPHGWRRPSTAAIICIRTSVEGRINGHPFQAVLEPDGQLCHWLEIPHALLENAAVEPGSLIKLELEPLANELEPALPPEFRAALASSPEAKAIWDSTTTIARIDWVHWIISAKQEKTRLSRITSACDMLATGKKRVCCFDPSGYYSKAFHAPKEAV